MKFNVKVCLIVFIISISINSLASTVTVFESVSTVVNEIYISDNGDFDSLGFVASPAVITAGQRALNMIINSVNNVGSTPPNISDYAEAGVSNVGSAEILLLINNAVISQTDSSSVDSPSKLNIFVNAILESQDDDRDGLPNIFEGDSTIDTDGDGIANRYDNDSDNDGISDGLEIAVLKDINNDNVIDITENDSDLDGIIDVFDADVGNDGVVDSGAEDKNFDGVNDNVASVEKILTVIANNQDGDLIPDMFDSDVDGDGHVDSSLNDVNPANGVIDDKEDAFKLFMSFLILNNDGDTVPNHLDLDSDNDGLSDVLESAGAVRDKNNDSLLDQDLEVIIRQEVLLDDDSDGTPNFLDLESNGVDFDILILNRGLYLDASPLPSGDGRIDDLNNSDSDGLLDVVDPYNGFGSNNDLNKRGIPSNDLDDDGISDDEDIRIGSGPDVITSEIGAFGVYILLLLCAVRFKKSIFFSLLLVSGTASAENWTIGIGIGQSIHEPILATDIHDTNPEDIITRISLGYSLDKNWMTQLRYADLGEIEVLGNGNSAIIETSAFEFNAIYHYLFFSNTVWQPYSLAGLSKINYEVTNFLNLDYVSEPTLQFGGGIRYTRNTWAARFEYTHYKNDLFALVLSFERQFPFNDKKRRPINEFDTLPKENYDIFKKEDNSQVNIEGGIQKSLNIDAIRLNFPANDNQLASYSNDLHSKNLLDEIARSLILNPGIKLEIHSHTDSTGSDAYNLTLSRKRAEEIRGYLLKSGISSDRLFVEVYGESKPIADNTTESGRSQNRRVEFKVIN